VDYLFFFGVLLIGYESFFYLIEEWFFLGYLLPDIYVRTDCIARTLLGGGISFLIFFFIIYIILPTDKGGCGLRRSLIFQMIGVVALAGFCEPVSMQCY